MTYPKDPQGTTVLVAASVANETDRATMDKLLQARFGTQAMSFLGWTEGEGGLWCVVALEADTLVAESQRVAIDSAKDWLCERRKARDHQNGDGE